MKTKHNGRLDLVSFLFILPLTQCFTSATRGQKRPLSAAPHAHNEFNYLCVTLLTHLKLWLQNKTTYCCRKLSSMYFQSRNSCIVRVRLADGALECWNGKVTPDAWKAVNVPTPHPTHCSLHPSLLLIDAWWCGEGDRAKSVVWHTGAIRVKNSGKAAAETDLIQKLPASQLMNPSSFTCKHSFVSSLKTFITTTAFINTPRRLFPLIHPS